MKNPAPRQMTDEQVQAVADRLLNLARPPEDWSTLQRSGTWRAIAERTQPKRAERAGWLTFALPTAATAAIVFGVWGFVHLLPHQRNVTEVASSEAGVVSKTTPAALENQPASPAASYQKSSAHRIDLGDIGTLELSETAAEHSYEVRDLAQERQIHFAEGRLQAHIAHQEANRPVVVVTPHLRVVVVGTRFEVYVDPSLTTVEVTEGRVRVEANGQTAILSAGDRIRSDDARLQATAGGTGGETGSAAPVPGTLPTSPSGSAIAAGAASTVAACESEHELGRRRECFERLARGDGLSAENALYALGQLARDEQREPTQALAYWRSYQRRFPDGALAPEVALNVLQGLLALNRSEEALAEASAFQQRFGTDPRAPEVALVRAGLLCSRRDRAEAALSIYRGVADHGRTDLRARALQESAACAQRFGLAPLKEGTGAEERGVETPGD